MGGTGKGFWGDFDKAGQAAVEKLLEWIAAMPERTKDRLVVGSASAIIVACAIPWVWIRLPIVGVGTLAMMAAITAAMYAMRRQREKEFLLRNSTARSVLESLRWRDFELLVGAVLEAEGWKVVHRGGDGPDGGIDLIAEREGKRWVVQCKKWDHESVGVDVIRSMLGVARREKAVGVMVFTPGDFTKAAREEYFESHDALLVDGGTLLVRIGAIRAEAQGKDTEELAAAKSIVARVGKMLQQNTAYVFVPRCEKCQKRMVLRYSRENRERFWACPKKCQTTPLDAKDVPQLDPDRR